MNQYSKADPTIAASEITPREVFEQRRAKGAGGARPNQRAALFENFARRDLAGRNRRIRFAVLVHWLSPLVTTA